ncbi:MAG: signal peptide peptidase SppA [Betaproteobacteria bacterium]|nr:signal peptide peptidase SppA [Betaproteobacteria bacterium]MDE2623033.1 signal peptide peptidase SppA [Betaproteobacteria bacterium]
MIRAFFRSLWHVLSFLWTALDASRRIFFNLLFLALLAGLLAALYYNRPPHVEPRTALVLDLKGALVEQHATPVGSLTLTGLDGALEHHDVQLRDVLQVLDEAARDPKITSVVLMLDDLQAAGMPVLHEVSAALERFKARGKPVIAWGAHYDQRQYYLAAHANELYLDPMGQVELEGFGHYRNYYRDALDKLGITVHVMRVGTYKSFAEPFIANGPSPAALEADRTLYEALWRSYTQDVEQLRHLPGDSLQQAIDTLPQSLAAAHGDTARLALDQHWVDGLKTRNDLRQLMQAKGATDSEHKTFRQISFEDYLSLQNESHKGKAIAVIVAEGEITDGTAPAGSIGGLTLSRLIRDARQDDDVRAVVVRVDSPGGSVYGSELIRRELALTREAGKPVVISMGTLAASGGYWLSLGADEIVADPDTVTGSIGVFALVPTADRLAEKLGIHTGGATTTWLSGSHHPLRPLDPRFAALIQSSVSHVYDEFMTRTAAARKTTTQKIDAVAQGRVWTGRQALVRGLVDRTGSFEDAVHEAASRARLGQAYHLHYMDPEPTGLAQWLQRLDGALPALARADLPARLQAVLPWLQDDSARDAATLMNRLSTLSSDPAHFMTVAHCLCQAP